MQITLRRNYFKKCYTIGELIINGKKVCDTLEPPDNGLTAELPLRKIVALKRRYGKSCIPYGTYKVLVTKSPKFNEWLPLLLDVPGFKGIRIHAGNFPKDTQGCILPGWNTLQGTVTGSRKALKEIMASLTDAYEKDRTVTIKICK